MNLAALLRRNALAFPERPAVAQGARILHDYGTLCARVGALAGALRARGLQPGDRIVLLMANAPEYVELLYGCWQAGLIAVPVNAKLARPEVAYVLEHAEARLVFVGDETAATARGAVEDGGRVVDVIAVPSFDYERMLDAPPFPEPEAVASEATAWLFYTSGTTGRPKGAMLSHRCLMAMTACYALDVDPIAPGDCILHAAPMSHGSGLYVVPHVAAGALNVVPDSRGFDADEVWRLTETHAGCGLFVAPTMLRRLLDALPEGYDPRGLKVVISGGAPLYAADARRALDRLGPRLAQIYGQGESPMTITALSRARLPTVDHPDFEARLASVGIAQSLVELRIADADGANVPTGTAGEVLVRGPSLMSGYWRDPAATEAAIVDGWLRTGDIGRLDGSGFLTLLDRSKDVIITGGSNVYPREVEEVLLGHPDVAEVCVLGEPDPEWGERVVAHVVAAPGRQVDAAALDRLCLEKIARFKRPKAYRFVDALPKSAYGKILKRELRS